MARTNRRERRQAKPPRTTEDAALNVVHVEPRPLRRRRRPLIGSATLLLLWFLYLVYVAYVG